MPVHWICDLLQVGHLELERIKRPALPQIKKPATSTNASTVMLASNLADNKRGLHWWQVDCMQGPEHTLTNHNAPD